MSKIYLGSTNPVKIKAVEAVVNSMVIGVEVDSGVSNQPFSDAETLQGAYNRAYNIKEKGLKFGLEAGVQMMNDTMFLVNWGVLIDENDNVYYAGGTRIPLPEVIKNELLKRNRELAFIIDQYFHTQDIKHHQGAIGILTNGLVNREEIFVHIVKLLYGQYLTKTVDK
jgi:inosine/xanthosine triphosphatase